LFQSEFFIGIEQIGAYELNVGLDRNNNAMDMQYYQTTGTWYLTQFEGAWMMRPVFGTCQDFLSSTNENINEDNHLFYPNPTNDLITFKGNNNEVFDVNIFDARGQLVLQDKVANGSTLNLDKLSNGIYYINMFSEKSGIRKNQKIMLSKP
jgi:hypothetical protein